MSSWMKGRSDWARVYSRLEAAKAGSHVPPPTKEWHEALNTSYYAGLSAHPFHGREDSWWCDTLDQAVRHLERFYPIIKQEMLALRKQDLQQYRQPQPHNSSAEREVSADGVSALLHESGDWNVLYLQQEGGDTTENEALAPKTSKIVRSVLRAAGHALFSSMDPDTHILPHCGPTNGRLRLHLGLVIPEGCTIRVGNEQRTWQEGRVIVIDDAFEHEVWNQAQSDRVVLIVDVYHPDFSDKEVRYLDGLRLARRRRHLDSPSELQRKQYGPNGGGGEGSSASTVTAAQRLAIAERAASELGRPLSFVESPFPTKRFGWSNNFLPLCAHNDPCQATEMLRGDPDRRMPLG